MPTFGGAAATTTVQSTFGSQAAAPTTTIIGNNTANNSTFVFGQPPAATTNATAPIFGAPSLQPAATVPAVAAASTNFYAPSNSTTSPFGTVAFGGATNSTTSNTFMFGSGGSNATATSNNAAAAKVGSPQHQSTFGQPSVVAPSSSSFGSHQQQQQQQSSTQLPAFGSFATSSAAPQQASNLFGSPNNTFGNVGTATTNDSTPFGSFGGGQQQLQSTVASFGTGGGGFGAATSNVFGSSGGASVPSGFVTPNCDEPSAKKLSNSGGFASFGSSAASQVR